ncbi:hypothetical protein ACO0OL_003660 [Hanseniaspora opuntiae]
MRVLNLICHQRNMNSVKYNREGDLLFTADAGGKIAIWNSITGELLGSLEGHQGAVPAMCASDDSRFMVTGSGDFSLKTWSLENGECLQTIESGLPADMVMSNDSQYVAISIQPVMAYKSSIQIFKYDKNTGLLSDEPIHQIVKTAEDEANGLMGFARIGFSFQDKYLFATTDDGHLLRYDFEAVLKGDFTKRENIRIHKGVIRDIQFSQDKTYLITASRDRFSKLIDVESLKVMKSYENMHPLNTAAITPLKNYVLIAGGQNAKDVTTTDSKHGGFEIKLLHKIFNQELSAFKGHFGPVNNIAVSPQGTSFTSGGEDGTVRVWFFEPSYFNYEDGL